MKKLNLPALAPLLGLLLFALALYVLHKSLTTYNVHDILRELSKIPAGALALAFGLTFFSYALMTGYDWLSFRYINHPLPYPRIALAAFIGYSLSNNVGNVVVTGGSVRYRIYSAWGLTALDITRVVLACSVTFALGILTLGGIYFVFEPMTLPPSISFIPAHALHAIGAVFLIIVGGYLALAFFRKTPFTVAGLSLCPPSPPIALSQVLFSSLDLAASAGVLYVLLPHMDGFSFIHFLAYYVLALEAGLISQVPGGLGVFESIMLVTLASHGILAPEAMGALLAYRGIYYILPLIFGVAMLLGQELSEQTHRLQPLAHALGWSAHLIVPNLMALLTFAAGGVLLLSGSMPSAVYRLEWLGKILPLALLEASHFLASLAGVGLLLLARGLQRRSDAAYHLTLTLLLTGIVLSLLKGIEYEEAMYLSLLLTLLIPCRRHFYRKASFFSERFSTGWIAAISTVLLTTLWLGYMSYKRIPYSGDLWWHFALRGDASRALRASVGVTILASCFAIGRLLRPAAPEPKAPTPELLAQTEAIVERSPHTYAWLAMLGDKRLLYDETGAAFIMYGVQGRSWVAMGDPVGPPERCTELIWDFRELCDRQGGRSVFYQVSAANLPFYLDLGLTPLKIGEEACISLPEFSLEGPARKGLRATVSKMKKEGVSFEIAPRESVPALLPELRAISEAWMGDKHAAEKRFSLGLFDETYLKHFPMALVRQEGRIIAFSNIWPGAGRHELSLDLMRHRPDAPSGVMEFLFTEILLWGREQGYQVFSMGMAPLSGLENRALAPVWNRIGAVIFRHGEHFYNFQGLRQFKDKFDPSWQPKYLVSPAGLALPQILLNIASLISGGTVSILKK